MRRWYFLCPPTGPLAHASAREAAERRTATDTLTRILGLTVWGVRKVPKLASYIGFSSDGRRAFSQKLWTRQTTDRRSFGRVRLRYGRCAVRHSASCCCSGRRRKGAPQRHPARRGFGGKGSPAHGVNEVQGRNQQNRVSRELSMPGPTPCDGRGDKAPGCFFLCLTRASRRSCVRSEHSSERERVIAIYRASE